MKESTAMRFVQNPWLAGSSVLGLVAVWTLAGCYHNPADTTEVDRGPAPLRMPSPAQVAEAQCGSYEDSLTGGQVFSMYCAYCHNAPAVRERPFSSYQNVAAHMRVRANLTGKEYAKVLVFLREVQDVPPPTPPVEPSPKRFFFSQPIAELRPQSSEKGAAPEQAPKPAPVPPGPGNAD